MHFYTNLYFRRHHRAFISYNSKPAEAPVDLQCKSGANQKTAGAPVDLQGNSRANRKLLKFLQTYNAKVEQFKLSENMRSK